MTGALALAAVPLILWVLTGCGEADRPTGPAGGVRLEAVAGDEQSPYLGRQVPVAVRLADAAGEPVVGVEIRLVVAEGDGKLRADAAVTDADGVASTRLAVGDTPGPIVIHATCGDPPVGASVTVTATAYARVTPAEVADLLGGAANPTGVRVAVRAALASGGCTLLDSMDRELTSTGSKVRVGAAMVDSLVRLEALGLRQTLAKFYETYQAIGASVTDLDGGSLTVEQFVEGLQHALLIAQENPGEQAGYLVAVAVPQGAEVGRPAGLEPETELSPVQSFLLLLALADVANPDVSAAAVEAEQGFFSGAQTFPLGLVVAGGLVMANPPQVTVAAPPPAAVLEAMLGETGYGRFLQGLPWPAGQSGLAPSHATVGYSEGGQTVAVLEQGDGAWRNHPPVVALWSPSNGESYVEGARVKLSGEAADPEDGSLSGASLQWSSDLDGELGVGEIVRTDALSVGAHSITLVATDSEGMARDTSICITVSANAGDGDLPPVATIDEPQDGSVFGDGMEVVLRGRGTDPEEGELEEDALLWYSSIDGGLGTGNTVTVPWLRPGVHTITLRVKDSQTSIARAPWEAVQITVAASPPTDVHTGEVRSYALANGEAMDFVWVGPGYFTMGGNSGEASLQRRDVRIGRGFWVGKCEVTQGQWEAVMGTAPWRGQAEVVDDASRPAVYISWEDVQDLVVRLNDGADGDVYRLPTEAEWEYACRAGTASSWSFGEAQLLNSYAWYSANVDQEDVAVRTGGQPIGTKLANPWGIHDMHGNVWEWVQDWYATDLGVARVSDPTGPHAGEHRVMRGGSYAESTLPGSAGRQPGLPSMRGPSIGVRLVRAE